ncbi:MAG: hypothetical protein ACRDQZ_09730 [Mycobacteriales bacterium]
MRLDIPLRMVDVAALAGWSVQKTRRRLLALEEEYPGLLTRRAGRLHEVASLATLRRAWPDIGKALATYDDIEDLREENASLRKAVRILSDGVKNFRSQANLWFRRLERLEQTQSSERHLRSATVTGDQPPIGASNGAGRCH